MNYINVKRYLVLSVFIMTFVFNAWNVLLNNFIVEVGGFNGFETGGLHSLRELPGLLAFLVIYITIYIKEQSFALASLVVLCLGVAMTGMFESVWGIYLSSLIMSFGFHYFETINQSLTYQNVSKEELPTFMGDVLSKQGLANLLAYFFVFSLVSILSYKYTYISIGISGLVLVLFVVYKFREIKLISRPSSRKIILKKNYTLFYILTFLKGARRQIFIVFASYMLVEKFNLSVNQVLSIYMATYLVNFLFARLIGRIVNFLGERKSLILEYSSLLIIFISYAYVENVYICIALYIADHFFFSMGIALKSYLKKIIHDEDIPSTASVSFTINHIGAVILPVLLGGIWVSSSSLVFIIGATLAFLSVIFSLLIPSNPYIGNESILRDKLELKRG
ncbi:MFS transporter [Vibrio caribbeanicus]|uniref:MFS transporter n=1 Tax=Vibrio caribbeanicus TaxID=701175 RepID=UPI002E123E4A|nr:MFS transporter [Vibrio caribbeanicus]